MTRNDTFFKILFAIEIALVPLVMAAYILMPSWSVGLFVAGVLVSKIWIELFKNKEDRIHVLINLIGNVLTICPLVIFFTAQGYINVVLCVFIVIFAVLVNVFKPVLFGSVMPEMVDAVDACYMLFECLTLIGLGLIALYSLVADIALFALLLTAVVSVAYKIYYVIRNYNIIGSIKNLFAKLFRRR